MKAYSSSSGGVIFVPDTIERATNKQKSLKYADISGTTQKQEQPLRQKILGIFKRKEKISKVA